MSVQVFLLHLSIFHTDFAVKTTVPKKAGGTAAEPLGRKVVEARAADTALGGRNRSFRRCCMRLGCRMGGEGRSE